MRIVSDGTLFGTKILDDDGEEMLLGCVVRCEWELDARRPDEEARVTLELVGVDVDLVGETDEEDV